MGSDVKECRDCLQLKPLDDFSPSKKNVDGRVSYSRECMHIRTRRYNDARRGGPPRRDVRAEAPEGTTWCSTCARFLPREDFGKNRSNGDGLTAYCRPCHNEKSRTGRVKIWGSTRDYHLMRRYGITSAQVDAMIEAQGGVCAICRERPAEHVDHDHATGRVREILCFCCNQGLGNLRHDADLLRACAAYLERHRAEPGTPTTPAACERPAPRWQTPPALPALPSLPSPRAASGSRAEDQLATLLLAHVLA